MNFADWTCNNQLVYISYFDSDAGSALNTDLRPPALLRNPLPDRRLFLNIGKHRLACTTGSITPLSHKSQPGRPFMLNNYPLFVSPLSHI